MKTVSFIKKPEPWFVYVAQTILSKDKNVLAYKNYLTLEKQHGSYRTFSEAHTRMEAIGRRVKQVNKGQQVFSSRGADWCVDFYLVPVPENDALEKDCYDPAYRGVEIIATPYGLQLNNRE